MTKDTKRIEQILKGIKSVSKLVRDERIDGGNWEHVEHELGNQEIAFTARLSELREHNARQEKAAPGTSAPGGE